MKDPNTNNPLDEYGDRISFSRAGEKTSTMFYQKYYSSQPEQSIYPFRICLDYRTIKKMNEEAAIAFSYALTSSIIASLPYTFKSPSSIQKQVVDYHLKEQLNDIIDGLCTAIYNGYAFGQKIYEKKDVVFTDAVQDDDGIIDTRVVFEGKIDTIKKIKFIDPATYSLKYFIKSKTEELRRVEQWNPSFNKRVSINRENLVWFCDGDPFDKIFGRSRYINIQKDWEIANVLWKYILEGIDGLTNNKVEVRYPEGITPTGNGGQTPNHVLAKDLLDALVSGSGSYTLPSSMDKEGKDYAWSVKYLTESSGQNVAIYNTIKDLYVLVCNRMSLGLFIPPNLNPVSESTSLGESQTSMELMMMIQQKFVEKIEQTISKDYIDDILTLNFKKEDIVPYSFALDKSIFNKRQIMKELLMTMVKINGQLLTSGSGVPDVLPDLKSILEQLDVPYSDVVENYKMLITQNGHFNASGEFEENDPEPFENTDENIDENTEEGALDEELDNEKREESREAERPPRTIKNGSRKTNTPGA